MTPRSNLQATDRTAPALQPLAAEHAFYTDYPWSLNPLCTVGDAAGTLDRELARLGGLTEAWQRTEAMINVFLLAGALLTAVEDALRGPVLRLPHRLARLPGGRRTIRALDKAAIAARWRQSRYLRRWRDEWQTALAGFLRLLVADGSSRTDAIAGAAGDLATILAQPLPARLRRELIRIPSAFRKQDLTHFDVIELADRFAAAHSNRGQHVVIVGLRTAGVYFAALMRARLEARGFTRVEVVTVRPNKGASADEAQRLRTLARAGYHAALIDDPPFSGDTIGIAVQMLRRAGFGADARTVLFPEHPLRRDWREHKEAAAFARETIITLPPEDWHKARLLASDDAIEARLAEYFRAQGYRRASVVENPAAAAFNAELEYRSGDRRRHRLKRVYAVRLDTGAGTELRHVFAKSVGWGWLAYGAFLVADRLAGSVPPLLGLRDGILYTEWLPQTVQSVRTNVPHDAWITANATYIAARAERLPVTVVNASDAQNEGLVLLADTLSAAYGPGVSGLMAEPLRRRLAARLAPRAALIDGRMAADEWIAGPAGLLKTDFEHHGIGKNEINLCDPTYDLADAALQLQLSHDDELDLRARYTAATGDAPAGERLLLCKLLAGLWTRQAALDGIVKQTHLAHRAGEFDAQYVKAWNFLTRESARYCGAFLPPAAAPSWHAPLAVLDLDGVVDRRIFGFPTTTAAGLRALALLRRAGFAVAVDTARPAHQVRDYCDAYGFAGGVAECGAYIWDATTRQGRVLVDEAALEQLAVLRALLKATPGVFVDGGYECSIRAYTYARKGTTPVPELLVRNLIAERNFDRLTVHQTTIDTTILAKGVDKGTGLAALLARTDHSADTIAVGDSETDLPMFAVAKRSFAPAHIDCARLARSVGCEIASTPFQRGLLEIAQRLAGTTEIAMPTARDDLFWSALQAADRPRAANLWRALREPAAYRIFLD